MSGDRSLRPQRLGGRLPFPCGDCSDRAPVSPGRGLDGIPRSPGCLPPGSGSSIVLPVPEVLRGGHALPVLRPLLRSLDGSPSIHPRHGSCILNHASSRVPHSLVPRRLVSPGFDLPGHCVSGGLSPLGMSLPQHHGQSFEKLFGPESDSGPQDYLGMTITTSPLEVFPTLRRVQKLSLLLQEFRSDRLHPVSVWRRLLWVMSSMLAIVPIARLRMRSLQLRLNASGPLSLDEDLVSWYDGCLRNLRWWSDESHLLVGLPFGEDHPDLFLYSDASDAGWGAALGELHLSGLWSPVCSTFSINHRELLAVLFVVQGFPPSLRGRIVALYSNNSTALAYLGKQGGTRSSTLNAVAQELLRLCKAHFIRLLPQFIPGHLNVLADSLSHRSQVLGSEWTLSPQAVHDLLRRWPATIDLFATSLNHRLPVYFSPMFDPQSAGTDAMLQSWDGLQACAFPPFGLLPRVLAKFRRSRGLELTLVAPFWPQHP